MQTSRNASGSAGLTLLEMLIVVTIIGLLTAIAITNVILARDKSRLTFIRHNLNKIDEAKVLWALDKKMTNGAPVTDVTILKGYLRQCGVHQVMAETYLPEPVGQPPEATLPPGVKLGTYGPGAVISAP